MTKCIYKASHCTLCYSVQDPLLTLFCFLWHFRISLSKPIALPPLLLLLLSELQLQLLQLDRQSFVTCSYQLKFNDIVGRRSWVWQSPVAGCQWPIAVVRMFLINFKWRFTFRGPVRLYVSQRALSPPCSVWQVTKRKTRSGQFQFVASLLIHFDSHCILTYLVN